jgi:hypothetical protein
LWDYLLFSYTTKVVWLGNVAESLDVGDLPIVSGDMRATYNFSEMRRAMQSIRLRVGSWSPRPGSGWLTFYRLLKVNWKVLMAEISLAAVSAGLFYLPTIFLRYLISYFEADPSREDSGWGWVYVTGLFSSHVLSHLGTCLRAFPFSII